MICWEFFFFKKKINRKKKTRFHTKRSYSMLAKTRACDSLLLNPKISKLIDCLMAVR